MKREKCRLETEACDQQQENEVALRASTGAQPLTEAAKVPGTRMGIQNHERSDQENQADVRGHQVVEPGKAYLLVRVVPDDQKPSRQGSRLPAQQEDQGVIRGVNHHEG
ncbi:hypothetical protein D9M68_754280 [compost metagenome]